MNELLNSLTDKEAIVVLGTGGVGKTTLAAALACGLARDGRRTLVITVDPSKRLKDTLNDGAEKAGAPTVDVLDVRATMERVLTFLADDPDTVKRIRASRFFGFLDRSLPGLIHYLGVFRIIEALEKDGFDRVIVDTPPMGHAVEFLTAADRILTLGTWMGPLVGRRGLGLPAFVLRTLKFFLGRGFANDLFEFLDAIHDIVKGFDTQAERARQLLFSNRSALLAVSAPDRAASADTARLLRNLPPDAAIQALILNRVLPRRFGRPDQALEALLEQMARVPGGAATLHRVEENLRREGYSALSWYDRLLDLQAREIRRTVEACAGLGVRSFHLAPASDEVTASTGGLLRLAQALRPVDRDGRDVIAETLEYREESR